MTENFLGMMHIAPLAVIALMVLTNIVTSGNLFKQNLYSAALLILSSIGIASGAVVHDHSMVLLIDPCLAYAATLVFVAFRLVAVSFTQVSANK